MAASTELVTPNRSSTSTVQLTPVTRVKVEHAEELITILSDDSDGNSPVVASVATQDRVFPHYVPNSSIKHSKSDSKDRSQEIL
jgi:hypothetical protein